MTNRGRRQDASQKTAFTLLFYESVYIDEITSYMQTVLVEVREIVELKAFNTEYATRYAKPVFNDGDTMTFSPTAEDDGGF